jgi:hypothetical protein
MRIANSKGLLLVCFLLHDSLSGLMIPRTVCPGASHPRTCRQQKSVVTTTSQWTALGSSEKNDNDHAPLDDARITIPSVIESPVLRQVYPAMMEHTQKYGNPNIPLGTSEGRKCQTLRRLHTQEKLSDAEIALLDSLGFTWHSLEEVYETGDFDDLFRRLLEYGANTDGDYSPPKKYPADPELGAWVTGIRRLGPDQVNMKHAARLKEIAFKWESDRKCGSAFMKQYRCILERLKNDESKDAILSEATIQNWIQAQREAVSRGSLSETRKHYMEQLVGEDWIQQVAPQ